MRQYLNLLEDILDMGQDCPPARPGLTATKALFGTSMEFDLRNGFPILTTKKMNWKAIVPELLWFLRGDTNIKYLLDNNCNIWNKDAYRWYKKQMGTDAVLSYEEFIEVIKRDYATTYSTMDYKPGDMGKIYGYQWRYQNGIDQIACLYNSIMNEPQKRYHILNAWNRSDFDEMGLPPCHLLYQFKPTIHPGPLETIKYLDMIMYQRSCDTFLGVPFDISMGAIFLTIMAELTNRIPRRFVWMGGDTHIYMHHLNQAEDILQRMPYKLPELAIHHNFTGLEDLMKLTPDMFELINYNSHPAIKAELIVGD